MGTNYYLHSPSCPTCGKPHVEREHIGKSSGGWCFALCYNEEAHMSLDDWKAYLTTRLSEGYTIQNEYYATIAYEDLISIITERSSDRPIDQSTVDAHNKFAEKYGGTVIHTLEEYLRRNHAEIGPNNLLRHRLGGGCVAHGEGTWDMIRGEFS
jgi:hypothetical protein